MRAHLRDLIRQAQRSATQDAEGIGNEEQAEPTRHLARQAIRLARLAASVHMTEAALRQAASSPDACDGIAGISPSASDGLSRRCGADRIALARETDR